MSGKPEQPASRMLVFGTVTFYIVAALAMVIANKWVLNTTETPLFFLFAQFLIAIILFLAVNALNLIKIPLEIDARIIKGLAPAVGLSVVGLSFSNYTLKYVDASFYQVARGMVLPFTVCTSYIYLHSRPSSKVLIGCAMVTAGFFVGVFLDGTPVSVVGISFGVASSLITATHSVILKRALDVVKNNALHLSWYSNLLSAFVLAPVILVSGEMPAVIHLFLDDAGGKDGGASPLTTFLWGSFITGVFGFLMSIASLLSIRNTSPITHMVSSAVRGVFATLLGMWIFHDIVTTGRASSIGVILAGSIYYTWVKHQESQNKAPAPGAQRQGEYEKLQMEDLEEGTKKPGDRQASD